MFKNKKEAVKNLRSANKILIKKIKLAKLFIHFKYPKLLLLVISIIAAYILFSNLTVINFVGELKGLGYIGFFIAGILFSFGFSAPFAVGFFIISEPPSLILASLFGALGGTIGNIIIFASIRGSFLDELKELENEKPIREIQYVVKKNFHVKMGVYLLYVLAGVIIASPLPNEIGVALLSTVKNIKIRTLNILSFILNGIGIIIILLLSR